MILYLGEMYKNKTSWLIVEIFLAFLFLKFYLLILEFGDIIFCWFRDVAYSFFLRRAFIRGTSVAQSVSCPTLNLSSGLDVRVRSSSPALFHAGRGAYLKKKKEKKRKEKCSLHFSWWLFYVKLHKLIYECILTLKGLSCLELGRIKCENLLLSCLYLIFKHKGY